MAETNGITTAEDEAQDEGRRMDPEIKMIGKFTRELTQLEDPDARNRIVMYLFDRFVAARPTFTVGTSKLKDLMGVK